MRGLALSRSRRAEWWRAGALAVVVGVFSVTNPVALLLLAAAVVWLAFEIRQARAVVAAGAAAALALWVTADSALVWLHRGWPLALAGAFVLLKTARPDWPLTAQALGAVGLAGALAAVMFVIWPDGWAQADGEVAATFQRRAEGALAAGLDPKVRAQLEGPVKLGFRWAAALFPAWLGLASMAALSLAEFFRSKLAGSAGAALGPIRDFRFNDQWVWLWIAGVALVLVPAGAALHRVGANAALLLGALYALRGFGVVLTALSGWSLGAGLLAALAALILYPILWLGLLGVLLLGVSDTWLDLRRRWARRGNR